MKKLLLTLIVFLSLTVAHNLTAQPYSNYINYSSVWGMKSGGSDVVNNYVSHFQYYINGDTIIGNYSYFKLYKIGIDSIIPISSGSPSATSVNYYAGALREDISKKFYFIYGSGGPSSEYILFDFNLTTGVYLQNNQSNYSCNNPQLMVQSYNTVYLGSTPLKKFILNNPLIQSIIEGVGSGGGLIEQSSMCLFYESYSMLICYKKNYDMLTINSNIPCTITLAVEEINTLGQFSISPNPFSTQTTLQTDNLFQSATLTVYNSFGQTVKQLENLSGRTILLRRDNLPSGLYFIRLTQDNKTFSDKLLIIDN